MHHGPSRKIMALTALLAVLGLFASCMGTEDFVQTVFLSSDVRGAYVISPEDHYSVFTPAMRVCDSEGLTLYFDEATGNAGVYDGAGKLLWSALPTVGNRAAAVLSAEAFNGTATYVLNSQDHAAAFGTLSSERLENGVRMTFTMADKEATARKQPEALTAGDVYVRVPLELTFANGRLTASVDMSRVVCAPGLILYHISLLPHFGAIMEEGEIVLPEPAAVPAAAQPEAPSSGQKDPAEEKPQAEAETSAAEAAPLTASADDFILVPDGCGAVVYPLPLSFRYPEVDLCVYGSDDSMGRTANVGAFGAHLGGGAFVCVLTEGEELAVIHTMREHDAGTVLYPVYASYNVTPAFNNNGEMAYGVTYAGKLSQTYAFLSGGSADAAGMARAARELLVYAGLLSAAPLEDPGYPVNIAVTGSLEGSRDTQLTDLEQAEALLSQLRAKGLDGVNLVLNGFLTGGTMKNAAASRLSGATGGRQALASLCDYAEKQGYSVFLGKDLLTAARGTALRDLMGRKKIVTVANSFAFVGKENYEKRYVGWSDVGENAASFLNAMEKTGATGFALTDLGTGLCADYATRTTDRLYVSSQLAEIAASYAAVRPLLVNGANCNVLRNADVITGVPCYTAVAETAYYRSVPFLPMLLHGSYCYSGAPVVSVEADKLALLRAVEYGCAPYFGWTGASRSDSCYENQLAAGAAFCTRAARELGDLTGLRMTDHYAIAEGVFCTEYGSGIRVFVNYNNYSVAVGTVSVPPYDYLRID